MTIIKKGSIITMGMKENAQGNEIEKNDFLLHQISSKLNTICQQNIRYGMIAIFFMTCDTKAKESIKIYVYLCMYVLCIK